MSQPRLLARFREPIRVRHYSLRTQKTCIHWVRRYIRFHGMRHPGTLTGDDVRVFRTHLAVRNGVAAATQNQALCAALSRYRHVLQQDVGCIDGVVHGKERVRVPVVMSPDEGTRVLAHMREPHRLVAALLYGAGPRLTEGLGRR